MSSPSLERDESVSGYSCESDPLDSLVGEIIIEARVNDEKDVVVLKTDNGFIYLTWSGDCCAICYLAHASGADNLIGAKILKAEQSEWKSNNNEDYEVIETMGLKLKTEKGFIDFETRLEHNGYYSGEVKVSHLYPIDNYGCALIKPDWDKLNTLKDF